MQQVPLCSPLTLGTHCNHLSRGEDGHLRLHGLVLEVGTEVAGGIVGDEGENSQTLEVDGLSEG